MRICGASRRREQNQDCSKPTGFGRAQVLVRGFAVWSSIARVTLAVFQVREWKPASRSVCFEPVPCWFAPRGNGRSRFWAGSAYGFLLESWRCIFADDNAFRPNAINRTGPVGVAVDIRDTVTRIHTRGFRFRVGPALPPRDWQAAVNGLMVREETLESVGGSLRDLDKRRSPLMTWSLAFAGFADRSSTVTEAFR